MILRASAAVAPASAGMGTETDGSWVLKVKRTVQKYSIYLNWATTSLENAEEVPESYEVMQGPPSSSAVTADRC